MQLLTVAIPALERLQKEGGEEGKQKINRITRYVTVVLAALQAIGIIAGLSRSNNVLYPEYNNFFGYLTIGVIMAGGTAIAMWIGERITKNGIGNGVSLLIFAGIISNLFNGMLTAFTDAVGITNYGSANVGQFLLIVVVALVVITLVTFVDMGERRIPVQYAKRVVNRKVYGGQSTHIPMKGIRKTRIGVVISDKMDKTVVVSIKDRVRHPLYGKIMNRTSKLKAHDEENACGVGDTVRLMETRPLSREKRWRVVEIIEKAK